MIGHENALLCADLDRGVAVPAAFRLLRGCDLPGRVVQPLSPWGENRYIDRHMDGCFVRVRI